MIDITLRRFCANDLDDFQAYRTDPQLALYQGWSIASDEEALDFINRMSQVEPLRTNMWIQLAICRSDRNQVIGDIGLCHDGSETEIGYTINRAYHHLGLATNAVHLAVLWAQTVRPCHRYVGITDVRNEASTRLLERLGFNFERTTVADGIEEHHYALTIADHDAS